MGIRYALDQSGTSCSDATLGDASYLGDQNGQFLTSSPALIEERGSVNHGECGGRRQDRRSAWGSVKTAYQIRASTLCFSFGYRMKRRSENGVLSQFRFWPIVAVHNNPSF